MVDHTHRLVPTYLGHVAAKMNKHFGFIRPEGATGLKDVFFHGSNVVDDEFENILPGDRVGFDIEIGVKGLAAKDIQILRSNEQIEDNQQTKFTSKLQAIVVDYCRRLAIALAKEPEYLKYVEWRDLEKVTAEALSGIGFDVVLTPGSKDNGRDIEVTLVHDGKSRQYLIELKHWVSGKKVGAKMISEFLEVVARERSFGGLFLSSSGFNGGALRCGFEIDRNTLKLGTDRKILSICRRYMSIKEFMIPSPQNLVEVIYEDTE